MSKQRVLILHIADNFAMVELVRFNASGTKYEVSRSLLNMYPKTMLARSASEEWQNNSTEDIFIARDGGRFSYVLDYLRDGRVILPLTVPKEALLSDLDYYGVEDVQEEAVFYSTRNAPFIIRGTERLLNSIYQSQNDEDFAYVANQIFQLFLSSNDWSLPRSVRIPRETKEKPATKNKINRSSTFFNTNNNDLEFWGAIKRNCGRLSWERDCNIHLLKVGLRIRHFWIDYNAVTYTLDHASSP